MRTVLSSRCCNASPTINVGSNVIPWYLTAATSVHHEMASGRNVWIHLARGAMSVNGGTLSVGDGVGIEGPATVTLAGQSTGEALLFDMGAQP